MSWSSFMSSWWESRNPGKGDITQLLAILASFHQFLPMTDPWDELYIYLHLPLKNQTNVGTYTIPLDPQNHGNMKVLSPQSMAYKCYKCDNP